MCNHKYTATSAQLGQSLGRQCPYPHLYEQARAAGISAVQGRQDLRLPLDDGGACIFHSRDVAWKRGNDFGARFLHLIQLLNAIETRRVYDFVEFIFVGNLLDSQDGVAPRGLCIADATVLRHAYFSGASFLDSFELDGVDFREGADFVGATFFGDIKITNARSRGLDFCKASFQRHVILSKVEISSFALFAGSRFASMADDKPVKFEDTRFEGITDFSSVVFASPVHFLRIRFDDFVDFGSTRFQSQVLFDEVYFGSTTEFIDTSFDVVPSAARYRGAAHEFNRITVPAKASLTFRSTDPLKKLFEHDVQFSFKEDPAGTIRFENVNFHLIAQSSREHLTRLAKLGRVVIGPGCIKYRFQTDVRTLSIADGNAPLVVELCQTFTNYFTASNGLNLGFEIVERDQTKVSFFYFTDEDITADAFFDRLAQTEQKLWNLLTIDSDKQVLAIEESGTTAALAARKESAIINAIDGISALLGTFFRVGARIALGRWKESDTKALLEGIRFNDLGADERARNLHRVIVAMYTDKTLFGINRRQNELLVPMVLQRGKLLNGKQIRILFLGANSSRSRLELDEEVKKIQLNLKLAQQRDNLHLSQEWAVTIDTLMQAILDESPTIVHFSGHGLDSGIVLQDEAGKPKIVSAESLSNLFRLFKNMVRCVVLNSCYSEHQAQAIRLHIPYVIGMSSEIVDRAAIAFSAGFYKALGAGGDIPFAFELGKTAIQLEGGAEEGVPVLLCG